MSAQEAVEDRLDSYEALYEAVMANPKGRKFLEEFAKRNRVAETNAVLEAVERLKNHMNEAREEARIDVLRGELQEMASAIKQTRGEIAAIKADKTQLDRFSSATGELEEITAATEHATSDILEAAEAIQTLTETLRENEATAGLADAIEEHTTNIFLACSFQDITGQRTTKVVSVLKFIEQRVNAMIEIWGITQKEMAKKATANADDQRPDAALMSGPAQKGEAIDQGAIDAMLSGDFSGVDAEAMQEAIEKVENANSPSSDAKTDPAPEADSDVPENDGPIDQQAIDDLFN